MQFSVASVLALATAAIAVPTFGHGGGNQCGYLVCTDESLLAIDLDINVLGLLGIDLDLDLLHNHQCKKVFCCPSRCEIGKHIPESCHRY
ncbi:hypothetical protein NOR_05331 [Metarhizium rileyi]|uniref:Hydrophobin n=1 Tax=Metarhizium rileyi (strain RCEF 4871) TaxID=1649241 RepID=A0A162JGR0_METRR|nr:hypothetical protein NOR_05331 [Metarhizium rileyi RCEF 4871]TWU71606.1 hypothetical protein ED733_000300 [Metarhizium rileyi]